MKTHTAASLLELIATSNQNNRVPVVISSKETIFINQRILIDKLREIEPNMFITEFDLRKAHLFAMISDRV